MARLAAACLAAALAFAPLPASAADLSPKAVNEARFSGDASLPKGRSALTLKIQILLDRAHVSPGVIDGHPGWNVEKAIEAFEEMEGLDPDGKLDEEVWTHLEEFDDTPVLTEYTITEKDVAGPFVDRIPEDYGEKAKLKCQCYMSVEEMLAERFHMDVDLLKQLNRKADFSKSGTTIVIADVSRGPDVKVARIEVDRGRGQLFGYDAEDRLVVAYPATVGSEENPAPKGTHKVTAIAKNPVYYYRPDVNFKQGDNDKPLKISGGPNSPVGSVWIDLSEPTYGIHGTPEPEKIDKVGSHGCVRLTNWDAEELAGLVKKGVEVTFVE